MKFKTFFLGLALCLALVPATSTAKTTKTIQVDCSKGDSINAALEDKADELIIEISGICEEDVEIRRDNVTLRGTDPHVDGVRGVAPGLEPTKGMIQVRNAWDVRLENLLFTGAGTYAVAASDTNMVEIENCRFVDNPRGVVAWQAQVSITNATFIDNLLGVVGWSAGLVVCDGCTVSGSNVSILVAAGGRVAVSNSSFEDWVAVFQGGALWIDSSTIVGSDLGVYAEEYGKVFITDTDVEGSVYVGRNSYAEFQDVTQSVNPGGVNEVYRDSTLHLLGDTHLLGDIHIAHFSELVIEGDSVVDGALNCGSGADAFCEDPAKVTGGSSCAQCVVP